MDIEKLITIIEHFKGANLRRWTLARVEEQLKELVTLSHYVAVGVSQKTHNVWLRGRIAEDIDGFNNLADCIYPKDGAERFERASYPMVPVFYGSQNISTVMAELSLEPGQFFQLIAVRPRKDALIKCGLVGEFERYQYSGRANFHHTIEGTLGQMLDRLNGDALDKAVLADAFLAEQFATKVGRPYEYKITAAFAKIFLEIGGMIYPSVQIPGGFNLAVPGAIFDEHFEVIIAGVYEVVAYYGYGVYKMRRIKMTCEFQANGDIVWDSKKPFGLGPSIRDGWQVEGISEGWRVK